MYDFWKKAGLEWTCRKKKKMAAALEFCEKKSSVEIVCEFQRRIRRPGAVWGAILRCRFSTIPVARPAPSGSPSKTHNLGPRFGLRSNHFSTFIAVTVCGSSAPLSRFFTIQKLRKNPIFTPRQWWKFVALFWW